MKLKTPFLTLVATAALAGAPHVYAVSDSVTQPEAVEVAEEAANETIMEKVSLNPQYSILAAALEQTGLDAMLKGDEGEYTVFAPDNAAFRKLPEGTVDELMLDENKAKLTDILKLHVVSGKVLSADIPEELKSAKGDVLAVTTKGDKVMVGDAVVTVADMEASNGVIHNLDTVLMP